MSSNLDRFREELRALLKQGEELQLAMQAECYPDQFKKALAKAQGTEKDLLEGLPDFKETYQVWYSPAKALVKQLLPDRLADFVRHYEKPKPRKSIDFEM